MNLVLQKAVPPAVAEAYLWEGFDRVAGYVLRAGEVSDVLHTADLRTVHLTDYDGSPFPRTGPLYILHFDCSPAWDLTPAELMTERAVLPSSGTAALEDRLVQLFFLPHTRLTAGARLWRFDGAAPVHVATYLGVRAGWVRHEEAGSHAHAPEPGGHQPEGSQAFTHPGGSVGPYATWGGQAYIADLDLAPDGSPATIHLVAVSEPPAGLGFTEEGGLWSREVSHGDLEALFEVRVGAYWNGIPVSVVHTFQLGSGQVVSRVFSLTRDWTKSKAAGLQELELGVWEATVPASEVLHVVPQQVAVANWMTPLQRGEAAARGGGGFGLSPESRGFAEPVDPNPSAPCDTSIPAPNPAPETGGALPEGSAVTPPIPTTPEGSAVTPPIATTPEGSAVTPPIPTTPGTVLDEPGSGLRDQAHLATYERIAQGTISHLPEGSAKVILLCQSLGDVLEVAAQAEDTDGQPLTVPTVAQDVAQAFGELRALSNGHEDGPWFAAVVIITSDGSLRVQFERERRPELHHPITAEMLQIERVRYPRALWPQWFVALESQLGR